MHKTIIYRSFVSRRRFGVELEASNNIDKDLILGVIQRTSQKAIRYDSWAQSIGNTFWHVKQDASCGIITGLDVVEKGWEIASFVGSGIQEAQHIGDVSQALLESGLEVNNNCGLHVHVEVADFSPQQMGVLLAHWIKVEKFIMGTVPYRRSYSPYCEPIYYSLSDQEKELTWRPLHLWKKLRPKDLSAHDNFFRWQSLNLVNYAVGLKESNWNRKTIEFRIPEGTLERNCVVNWIRLFVNFVDYVKYRTIPDDLNHVPVETALCHLGIGHSNNVFQILSPGLNATRVWLLERAVKHGVYRKTAQNILDRMQKI